MNKFFNFEEDIENEGWYHIKARCMDIWKPDGKVITFWLWGNSEQHIKELLKKGNNSYKNIEWIKKEKPTWES